MKPATDEGDEPARLIVLFDAEQRDVRQEYRVIAARDFDVIRLAARSVAELLELEPHDVLCVTVRVKPAVIECERRIDVPGLGYRCTEHVPTQNATHIVLTRQA